MILIVILTIALGVIWHIPFFLLMFTSFRLYKTSDRSRVVNIQKKITNASIFSDDKPVGLIWNKEQMMLGLIIETSTNKSKNIELWMICKPETWDLYEQKDDGRTYIQFWEIDGTFQWQNVNKRPIDVTDFEPRKSLPNFTPFTSGRRILNLSQAEIVDKIYQTYKEKNTSTAFVYGNPGSGKSALGLLVAKKLNGSFCKAFNPFQPGLNLSLLYLQVEPTQSNPLVILLDEIDVQWDQFPIQGHKDIPTQIVDKRSWNSIFDDINLGLYPHLVVILTSNKPYTDYDLSFTRDGRIDNRMVLNSP